jgi:hypothetical protein
MKILRDFAVSLLTFVLRRELARGPESTSMTP